MTESAEPPTETDDPVSDDQAPADPASLAHLAHEDAQPDLPPLGPMAESMGSAKGGFGRWVRRRPEVAGLVVVLTFSVALLVVLGVRAPKNDRGSGPAANASAVPLGDGRTEVVDARDGFSLTLPPGWRQVTIKPSTAQQWANSGQGRAFAERLGFGSAQRAASGDGVLLTATYAGPGGSGDRGAIAVLGSSQPIAVDGTSAALLERQLSSSPALAQVTVDSQVLGAGPVLHAASELLADLTTDPATPAMFFDLYLVPSSRHGGFVVIFGATQRGTVQRNAIDILESFDPEYQG